LNGSGQLGNGTFTNSNTPAQVSGLSGVTAIAGGAEHSLALKSDGTVWAWGNNALGQLGNGTFTDSNTPVQVLGPGGVGNLSGVTALAVGGGQNLHSLALKSDGTVWAWGFNNQGQLGNATFTSSNTPVQVSGLSGVTAIAGGVFHSLALKSDGTVWAWGFNGQGQLGNGTNTDSNTPVQTSGLTGVRAIAGGNYHSLAMKNDGTVWAWGSNGVGSLGNGTFTSSNTPVQVLGPGGVGNLTGVTALAAGFENSLALKSDGTVWAWGFNIYGQLGNGTNTTSNTPAQVLGAGGVGNLTGVTALAGALYHSLALKGAFTPAAVLNITPPPSVQLNALESNQSAFFFAERVSSVLPSAIAVDATLPGTYDSVGSLTLGTIPAGTVVDSFLLHADPFDPNNGVFYSGSVSFLNPILGVIALSGSLDQTDVILGAPGTLYPVVGSEPARGFELGSPDMFVISPDGKTLSFTTAAGGADDQLRIVTAASPPQPVAPGTSTTFTSPNVINQTVTIPPDANMNGAATMRVSFIQVAPAVFNASIAAGTSGNTFSGGRPVPAGTTCTPIAGAGGNCIITENKCFDANGTAFALCPITATTTPIQLTSQYETSSPQPNPALLIASDGQSNYAVITTGFNPTDLTISGGTKGLNSDEVIGNLPGSLPSDTVPPTTTASTSPLAPNGANGWFTTSPVSVILASTDDTLVKQIAYSAIGAQPITSTTVLGASTLFQIANQGVTTISYQATDQAENVEPLKTLTVKIDTTPPSISITSPTNGATYTINQPVAASYRCTDPESSPAPSCTGPVASGSNIDAASVGGKVFAVNSTDTAGLSSTQSVSYSVSYNLCILYNLTNAVKSGATIPLKLYLCDASGKDVSNSGVIVHATKLIQVSTQATDAIVTAGNANPDNDFRFDSALGPAGGYVFNLKANLATGVYNLYFTAGNDPSTSHFLTFQVN